MYNILISLGASLVIFALVALTLQPVAAIFPAVLVLGVVFYLLTRYIGRSVEADLGEAMALVQQRKVDEAAQRIEEVKQRWGRWQLLLSQQLDAQLGLLQYIQMKWDAAYPLLARGSWRNWTALTCMGCIKYREGDKDEAWALFDKAARAAGKEPIIYLVWATLLVRSKSRDKALDVLARGLKKLPNSQALTQLRSTVANKKRINTRAFPQTWYQFFPEDMARQVQGRVRPGPQPSHGFKGPRMSRKMRRGG